ncbi:hsp70 family protein, partial [Candidatus Binatia bacterium]|nr:hsp70 family protein [Candidatus Binatia bacterium]
MSDAPRGPARFVVGIDLGTTNSAVAWAKLGGDGKVQPFAVRQLVAEGEVLARPSLPSAIYLAGEHDVPPGALALPWRDDRRWVVGALARRLGDRVAGRLVTSAKSWLCHGGVDRTAAILPWGGDPAVAKLSPVAASARILEHLREAWDAEHEDAPLTAQEIVLTVPASFDEVARELTVQAATSAGFDRVRLLEEPQAAIYAWIHAHPAWRELLAPDSSVLVVDVGGGTTDFSLIVVRRGAEGLGLERVAVGEHLLLGGDNVDLALARLVAERSAEARGLDAARWQQLTSLCRDAKERLLGDQPPETVTIAVPGRGRGIVKGTVSAQLSRSDVLSVVLDGFVPVVPRDARPRAGESVGLTEFGLPYASDPQITRHLAAFLADATDPSSAHAGEPHAVPAPTAVLFNGGALKSSAMRARLLDTLEAWFGTRPVELSGADLELAVARGAATYGLALRGVGARIAGGAARAYYVGIAPDGTASAAARVLCVAPRGMQEGAEIEIALPEFEVLANAPVRFPIFASATRTGDEAGALLALDPSTLVELPPISTVLRFGRSLTARSIAVHLRAVLTETGTLELWCLSRQTDHRWRLNFDLRGRERPAEGTASPVDAATPEAEAPVSGQEMVVAESRIAAAVALLEGCFVERPGSDPKVLMRALEEALDAGKDAWPVACVRRLWDALFTLEAARERTADHEARWLNLAGFLLRPGYGEERDGWRVEHLWRRFDAGPRFANAPQVRAEWWTMWKRVAGGLTRQQQQALLAFLRPVLLPHLAKKSKIKWKAAPQELREMWQVAASLEKLPAGVRQELATALATRVVKGKTTGDAEVWALGRIAARQPIAGPVSSVIEPRVVEPWLSALADAPWERRTATVLAVAQMARVTGDRARDVDPALRERLAERIASEPEGRRFVRWLREVVATSAQERALVLAESLPVG